VFEWHLVAAHQQLLEHFHDDTSSTKIDALIAVLNENSLVAEEEILEKTNEIKRLKLTSSKILHPELSFFLALTEFPDELNSNSLKWNLQHSKPFPSWPKGSASKRLRNDFQSNPFPSSVIIHSQ
jgi:hypothetical protein